MKKTALIITALLLTLVFAAGCGSKDGKKGDDIKTSSSGNAEKGVTINDYDLKDYVKLGDYKGISVSIKELKVSDDEVTEYANKVAAKYPDYKKVKKLKIEDGDVVNIDYKGTIDGEEFDGGSDKGYHLTIGSGNFIAGFEEGLIGAKVGSTKTLNLTFPDDYQSEDVAGKDVVFEVKINSIDQEIIYTADKFTDEYISANFGFDTVKEFMNDIRASLSEENEQKKEENTRNAVIDEVMKVCEAKLPKELLKAEINSYKNRTKDMIESYGYEFEDYIQQYYGVDAKTWSAQVADSMETRLKQNMVFLSIADKENIKVDDEGYAEYESAYVENWGYKDAKALYEVYPKSELQSDYRCGEVVDLLLDQLNISFDDKK